MNDPSKDIAKCSELMEKRKKLDAKISEYPLAIRAQARYGIMLEPCPICGKMPEMVNEFSYICVVCRDCRVSFKAGMFLTTPKRVAIEGWNRNVAQMGEYEG